MIDESETMGYTAEPTMDEDGESDFHRAARETMEMFLERGLRLVWQYKGNKLLALMAWTHAMGFKDLTGCEDCETATDIAVKLFRNKKKKAAVTKAIKYLQDNLKLPPTAGQRSEEGRQAMQESRNKQLVNGGAGYDVPINRK